MLFRKALKAGRGVVDKGCVSTLAHTANSMSSPRPAEAAAGRVGDDSVRPAAPAPVGSPNAVVDRGPVPSPWDGADSTEPIRMGRKAGAGRGRGLHGQLVQQLGQMIVSGDLGADRPLVPEEIGQRFEVSRTVVRESLRVLEAKGLVSARPNVGTRVRPVLDWNLLDPDIVEWRAFGPHRDDQRRELFELRWAIEPLAARLAAGHGRDDVQRRLVEICEALAQAAAQNDAVAFARADAEFHGLLLQAAGNRMLEHLVGIVGQALQVSGGASAGCERPSESAVGLHRRLVDALGTGDGAAAEATMRSLLTVHPEIEHAVPAPREH
ncbi:GntR family transcriptional regulator [Mangrovactinospora gilvigrisea]|uniref:GntR family transcriptional regulator n=1 Tax=Mangrovactinospora gilvigrisea TaxID=1428644 RepID=A0A1J7C2I1_9ACTN|nr:FadR/GntR family transcriptional regulator [Mangrovactinospora gilvigrisea]OIV35780.1 GntR family transcriptional regulator [Mangrovactinospora gilvigrisea]